MIKIIQPLSLDVAAKNRIQAIFGKQYDKNSRFLKIRLTSGDTVIALDTTCIVTINAMRADSTSKAFVGKVNDDGTVTVPLTAWMLELDDRVICDITVVDTDGSKLTSGSFELDVESASYKGEGIEDDEEYDAWVTLLSDVAKKKAEAQDAADNANSAADNANSAADDTRSAALAVSNATKHLPIISSDGYWMLWDDQLQKYVETSHYSKGDNSGADGFTVDPEDGKLYLTSNGIILGEGITLPENGTGFDSIVFDESGYLHIQADGEDVVDPVYIGTGGGGGGYSGSKITLVNKNPSRTFSVMDSAENVNILYSVTSVDTDTSEPTGDLTASWYVNGNRVQIVSITQGDGSFNVKNYLTAGATNTVKLTVEDAYGGSKSMTWTVTVTSYTLTWNIENFANHGSQSLNLRLVPNGQGNKTVKVSVDGNEVYEQVVATSGRAVAVTIPVQTHGAHTILAWMETTIDGTSISTTPLRHVGIWFSEGNDTPIVAFLESSITVSQYSTAILKYRVFNPVSESTDIILSATGDTTKSVTVGRDTQTWAYKPTTSGTKTLSITCGNTSAVATVTVTASLYDIQPVTRGLIVDLDPSGHVNEEAGHDLFGYTDWNGVNHHLTFSPNFDWVSGGFQQDSEGVTALVIKRSSYVEFDRSFFNDDAKTSGKEIKIVFKSTECRNYDATIASCLDSNIGIKLQAQQATLSSALQSATVQYCEDKKIEMDINIESSAEDKIAVVWLEGIPSRGIAYENADNWQQANPSILRIGSPDCDVWIYRIKMYSTSLTRSEVLDNYIADCGNVSEMIDRYERNDIYNTGGTINESKLANARPELRVIHITADRMTTSKSDVVPAKVSLTYKNGGAEYEFSAENVSMKAQGTSSLEYILAALNLDLDFSSATSWLNGNNEPITGYSMTPNSIPVNYINIKLNVASSENANNVCCTDDYNTFQPHINPQRAADPRVRDVIEGHPCAVFFTNSSGAKIEVGARSIEPGETIMYGCGDICNSKKNFEVFGQDLSAYPEMSCVEIGNNNNLQCRFKSDDLSSETWDGDMNFEFRFPKKPTQANKDKWAEVLSWVVSTDPEQATGAALLEAKTYGSNTYTTDTAEYRKAKFRYEFENYFSLRSMLYHYLFTERHCMVDNRAKNCFVSYEYDTEAEGYRWNFCKDYDNDTMAGNDNSGGLTFTYGLEDTDMVGAAYVFNAYDSVLWTNLKDCFADELKAMYLDREAAGAWNAERIISKWKTYQSARPEALVIEDMWGKYFTPYIKKGESRYIKMMLGTKEDQFRQFQTYQEQYMSAKYGGSVSTADRISLRANAPAGEQAVPPYGNINGIVPYASTYVTVKYGNAGTVKVRAMRGQSYDIAMPEGASLNDLETYIYSASNISSIGSFAALYSKFADISSAKRLQQLILGDGTEEYANTSMNSENGGVSFGSNIMMEKIDLRGLPQLNQGLDLSSLKALKEIYTTGSGITGVTFARRAPVKTACLNPLRQLIARDLTELETFDMSYTELQTVWIDNCPLIDTKALVMEATNLTRGRIIGVDWTGDKSMSSAALLNRLAKLSGIDATGGNTDTFVLTGTAHVTVISTDDLVNLTAKFPELELTYGSILPKYTVTFKNYDGTVLNTQRVDQGSAPVDPTQLPVSPISAPTKPMTIAKQYTHDGWSWTNDGAAIEDLSKILIIEDTVLYAHYAEEARTYKVRWYNGDQPLGEAVDVEYGESAVYQGEVPIHPLDEQYATYYLFSGWDKSTGFVSSDINVYAQYDSSVAPSAGTPLSSMRPVQLKALIKTGVLSGTGLNNNVIASGDEFDLIMGKDYTFNNVESYELVSIDSPKEFEGTRYITPQINGENIKLFDEDKSFVLAVDFKLTDSDANSSLVACGENNKGFLLRNNNGGNIKYGASSNVVVSDVNKRELVVIRKHKGDSNLYIYASNTAGLTQTSSTLKNTLSSICDAPLTFGANIWSDGYTDSYGKGTIYWAKLWMDDLGDAICKDIASWTREVVTMKASGIQSSSAPLGSTFRLFKTPEGKWVNCCFLAKDLLFITRSISIDSVYNTGGWKATDIRQWLNTRVYNGLPLQWKALAQKIEVKSTDGKYSHALTEPPAEDYIFIPSAREVSTSYAASNGLGLESEGTITYFTTDASRVKKLDDGVGAASGWHLRSPVTNLDRNFHCVNNTGSIGTNHVYDKLGVCFGFCI